MNTMNQENVNPNKPLVSKRMNRTDKVLLVIDIICALAVVGIVAYGLINRKAANKFDDTMTINAETLRTNEKLAYLRAIQDLAATKDGAEFAKKNFDQLDPANYTARCEKYFYQYTEQLIKNHIYGPDSKEYVSLSIFLTDDASFCWGRDDG